MEIMIFEKHLKSDGGGYENTSLIFTTVFTKIIRWGVKSWSIMQMWVLKVGQSCKCGVLKVGQSCKCGVLKVGRGVKSWSIMQMWVNHANVVSKVGQ